MKCSRCETELGHYAVCQVCGAINSEIMFINCTPHEINETVTGTSFPPSGFVARCSVIEEKHKTEVNNVPIYRVSYGSVVGLPSPRDRTIYIVSLLVRQACQDRRDLVCPGELVRDPEGRPVGCKGFRM